MSNIENGQKKVPAIVQEAGLIALEGAALYGALMVEGGMKLGTVIYERTRGTSVHDRVVEALRDRKDIVIKVPQEPQV